MNGSLDMNPSDQQTQYLLVAGSDQAGGSHEDDEESNAEEKYELFRNMSSKTVWEVYCALMKGDRCEGGDVNRNNNDDEQDCVQEIDGQQEKFESTDFQNKNNARVFGLLSR